MLLGKTCIHPADTWPFTQEDDAGALAPSDELLAHLHADPGEEANILRYLKAACRKAEEFMERALTPQVWEFYFNDLRCRRVAFPYPPLQEVVSIERQQEDGTRIAISSDLWTVLPGQEPTQVVLRAAAAYWPYDMETVSYVATMVCGYLEAGTPNIPDDILQAILLTVATWYTYREDTITGTIVNTLPDKATDMLEPHRVKWGML